MGCLISGTGAALGRDTASQLPNRKGNSGVALHESATRTRSLDSEVTYNQACNRRSPGDHPPQCTLTGTSIAGVRWILSPQSGRCTRSCTNSPRAEALKREIARRRRSCRAHRSRWLHASMTSTRTRCSAGVADMERRASRPACCNPHPGWPSPQSQRTWARRRRHRRHQRRSRSRFPRLPCPGRLRLRRPLLNHLLCKDPTGRAGVGLEQGGADPRPEYIPILSFKSLWVSSLTAQTKE